MMPDTRHHAQYRFLIRRCVYGIIRPGDEASTGVDVRAYPTGRLSKTQFAGSQRMELRHLRYFVAVAEHATVRRAAEHLYISQPAVSRQIHALESELGVDLFARSARGLSLSPAGAEFLTRARHILNDVESAGDTARRIGAGLEGALKIGFVENAAWEGLLPAVFRQLEHAAPDVGLELTPLNTPAQFARLDEGRLDGGFVYPFGPLPLQFFASTLVSYNVVLALPRAWNLSANPPRLLRELSNRAFITFPRHVYPAYYDRLYSICMQLSVPLRIIHEVSSEAAILSLVSSGMGAAIVNSANRFRAPALVEFVTLDDLSIPMPLTFVHRKDNANPALRVLKTAIERVLAENATGQGDALRTSPND